MKKQHDEKNGCGAKRFSGAHPFRRAFRMQSVMLFSFVVAPAVARAVFESKVQGVYLSAGAPAPALVSRQAHALLT